MAADSPRVRPEREMRRVRKLTCAAYANQRMTLTGKLRQSIKKKRNTMIALRGLSTWRIFIIHVSSKAFGDAFQ